MGHLGPRVLMLPRAGISHRQNLSGCLRADHHHCRVFHGQSGTDVAVDPLHPPLGFDPGPLGHQVVDVVGPVLDSRVGHPGRRLDNDLYNRRVEGVGGVDRR